LNIYGILNIHYPGTRRIVKNYPGSLLPAGTAAALLAWIWMWTWTWNFVSHMHNCTCITNWHDILSLLQYISPAIELKKLMGHGSTPSDPWPMWPIRFSWPIWPM